MIKHPLLIFVMLFCLLSRAAPGEKDLIKAKALEQKKQFSKALVYYSKVLTQRENSDASVLYSRAACYAKAKDFSKGEADFENAFRANPKLYASILDYAEACYKGKDYMNAIHAIDKIMPEDSVLQKRSDLVRLQCYSDLNTDRAAILARSFIERSPSSSLLPEFYKLSLAPYFTSFNYEKFMEFLPLAYPDSLERTNAKFRFLGNAALFSFPKNMDSAIYYYQQMKPGKEDPKDKDLISDYNNRLAEAYFRRGVAKIKVSQPREVVMDFEEAFPLMDENQMIPSDELIAVADFLILNRYYSAAEECLTKIPEYQVEPEALKRVIIILHARGEYKEEKKWKKDLDAMLK